jgi:hypothetical protein
MKNKYIIVIFVIGLIITILGSLFKITHWEIYNINGNLLLTIGMFCEIAACLIFVFKLLTNKNNNGFLDK